MFKSINDNKNLIFQVMAFMMLIGSLFTIGTVNLSAIWSLMQEVVDNTDVIVGLVILGVVIGIAYALGDWIKKLLGKAIR
jgi:uncharacterized membrane-anchored protein